MNGYTTASIILTLAVLFGYVNQRFIRLQTTIAIMVGSLSLSLLLIILKILGASHLIAVTRSLILGTDFHNLLLNGMLSFLLFAGALTVDFAWIKKKRWEIGVLATISTIASTFLIGIALYFLLAFFNIHLEMIFCLLFGALISPTDPIAVLATFKEVGAPKDIEVCVAGESLFNDGVGIVIFICLYQLAFSDTHVSIPYAIWLFIREAVGGIAYGWLLGYVSFRLIRSVTGRKIAILITLATVSGGYTLATKLGISGPLAMVVAGLIVGDKARTGAMRKDAYEILELFWEIIDEILNAILFLLIGFEILAIRISFDAFLAAIATILLVLVVRYITVAAPLRWFRQPHKKMHHYAIMILTWGGLRGGLAVALALSLPASYPREFILTITYAVVAFAVIVQGLTIKPIVRMHKQTANKV